MIMDIYQKMPSTNAMLLDAWKESGGSSTAMVESMTTKDAWSSMCTTFLKLVIQIIIKPE
jgi:hypothetical protein